MQQTELSGILLMDKPQGFTSHDVVAKLRGILHTRKIGHGGTRALRSAAARIRRM